ncbi:ParB/RepB/Spo0J family partition protein [Lusitaniella coriacea]|uniref:ParB/RepB/Spo0J family partition protein n=1 Tax=Lusitaniella coriacea TaxID=1983105 RepID=UPI003CF0BBD0
MMKKTQKPYKGSLTGKVNVLFGGTDSLDPPKDTPTTLPVDSILLPDYQPRQYFDETKLTRLAETIARQGIVEPLLVRPKAGNRYELVAGGRRFRAAQMARLSVVPVVVLELSDSDALEVSILENLQREDLNPVEETEGILKLLSARLQRDRAEVQSLLYRMRNEAKGAVSRNVSANPEFEIVSELFSHLGITWKSFVETRLPLLKLPPEIWEALGSGKIEYTKARAIARVKDPQTRADLLEAAIASNLSLSQIKERIKALVPPASKPTPSSPKGQFEATARKLRAAKLWENPKKWKKAQTLLDKLEALLEEE